MREVGAILNSKAISLLRHISEREWHAVGRNVSSLLIAAGFTIGVFLFVRMVTVYLMTFVHAEPAMLFRLVSLVLFIIYISINLLNLIVSYATLYNADEVSFLFSLPIHQEKIFIARLVENFISSSSTLSLVVLAALLGFWSYFAVPWYAYVVAMFLVFVPFVMGAATIGVIMLMGLVAFAARFGVRWMLSLALIVYVGMTYAGFRTSDPAAIMRSLSVTGSGTASGGYLESAFLQAFPSGWVTAFLQKTSQGDFWGAALPVAGLMGILAASLLTGWLLAKRYYYGTWVAAAELRTIRRGGARDNVSGFLGMRGEWLLRSDFEAFLRRDTLRFLRDPVQRLHLLMMGVLLLTFLFSLQSLDFPLATPTARSASVLLIFVFNGFFLASLALRFVYPSVSLEGDAFWCVRSAPISLVKLYWLKFAYAQLFLALVGAGLGGVALNVLPLDGYLRVVFSGFTLLLVLGITSLNLGAGAYFGTLKEKNPVRVASSQGASLTFLGGLVYILCLGIGLFASVQIHFSMANDASSNTVFGMMMPNAIALVFAAAVTMTVNLLGIRALHKDL